MYKVVCNIDGKLNSAYVHSINELNIEYEVGKWTWPKIDNTKIFVFSQLLDARRFTYHNSWQLTGLQIYLCSTLNPVYHYNKYAKGLQKLENFISLWKSQNKRALVEYLEHNNENCAWNTAYCDAIKLIKRVG